MIRTDLLKLLVVTAAALFASVPARAVDFHVATAQGLQNALTLAAGNGADNVIYLTNGYYTGNFNFNSTGGHNLTIQAEPGVTNTDVALDGANLGRDMNLVNTATGNFTVLSLTFLRTSAGLGALRIAGGPGSSILVDSCRFLLPTNSSGLGMELSGLNATVAGCTVIGRSGLNNYGGGMSLSMSGVVVVQGCVVATNNGGGVAMSGANMIARNNSFLGNTGGSSLSFYGIQGTTNMALSANAFLGNIGGPAAWCQGGTYPTITVSDNTFGGNGGGFAGSGGTVTISNNNFYGNNYSSSSGGGASCSATNLMVVRNTFSTNYAGGGGGLYGSANGPFTMIGNTFSGNSANSSSGGGASCSGTPCLITGNTFIGNSAASSSGGLSCGSAGLLAGNLFVGNSTYSGPGGGLYCSGMTVSNNTFIANSASGATYGYGGGGVFNLSSQSVLVANVFKQNTATSSGGGVYATGEPLNIVDNVVVKNAQSSSSAQGGGIWVSGFQTLNLINNTVFGNVSGGSGGGAAFQVNGTTEILNVYNNIIWGNSANVNGGDVWLAGTGQRKTFLYNDVHDMYGVWDIAQNLVDVDPLFFDPVNADLHIQNFSPCKDAGTNGAPALPATDLDGSPRIAGVAVDLGAYEFSTALTHPADLSSDFFLSVSEFNNYAVAWKNGQPWNPAPSPIPADYMTRAGYLMTNGGAYRNDGSGRPVNWKLGP